VEERQVIGTPIAMVRSAIFFYVDADEDTIIAELNHLRTKSNKFKDPARTAQ